MSDNFLPLNQSTPLQQPGRNQRQRFQNNHNHNENNHRRGGHNNNWGNSPRSSVGSNSSNTSNGLDSRNNIDAYLHPSMLQDPWESLRQQRQCNNSNS